MPATPDSVLTAKISEWNDQKGYGFLQVGTKKIFLHRSDFAERHKRPAVGDVIHFVMGQDAKGRPCATQARHLNDGGRIRLWALLLLVSLLILPALALYQRGADFRWVGAYAVGLGLFSYGCYALDKRRARAQEWRVPESTLHLTELLDGWPWAFLAQHRLRHKVSKPGHQLIFWLIVLGYQFVAYDSLQNWRITSAGWNFLHAFTV